MNKEYLKIPVYAFLLNNCIWMSIIFMKIFFYGKFIGYEHNNLILYFEMFLSLVGTLMFYVYMTLDLRK